MKYLSTLAAAAALAALTSPAMANMELAQKKSCLACHGVEQRMIGPSYKEVAAKYKGQKGADAKLVEKVLKGGKGAWGEIPMPANPQVSEAEAKELVHWILSMK